MAYTEIDDPSAYFQTAIYTGNATGRTITFDGNSDMQPDLVWGKVRSEGQDHVLVDSIRGATKQLYSSDSAAEQTEAQGLTGFASDGFTLGTHAYFNGNSKTYVAWGWKAGTSFTNDASSTSIGTIDSTGSVNTDAGFSITSFTANGSNATIAHGLGAVPQMVILKNRSISKYWATYHSSLGEGKAIFLDTTAAADADNTYWNNTAPTSTTFSFGTNSGNNNGNNMIAYCFAEKQGYSKFGSYVGNGNVSGTFFYTGFKPAFIIQKRDATHDWQLHDNKRGQYFPGNVVNNRIQPNSNNAEGTGDDIGYDFLSNGFKTRTSNANYNASGSVYIYMAFAENPFVTSTGVPATAR